MKYTGNYNLKKPEGTDVVNIDDLNDNADIIDSELKKLNDAIKDLDADSITLPDGKTISEKFTEITKEIGNTEELDTETKLSLVAAINEINQALVAHKAENATTSAKGHVQLSDSTSSTSTSLAATANAVRVAYNKAVEALNKANEAFQSASDGKNLIATAITGKGIPASGSDSFELLSRKISEISTGGEWASGTIRNLTGPGDSEIVSGLGFKPRIVIVTSDFYYNGDFRESNVSSVSFYSLDGGTKEWTTIYIRGGNAMPAVREEPVGNSFKIEISSGAAAGVDYRNIKWNAFS